MNVIGIDLGGTHIQIGVVDRDATIVGRTAAETEADRGLDHVLDTIAAGVREACARARCTLESIAAVGVAAAGAIDMPRGVVLSAPNLHLTDVPLADRLRARLGRPVVLENDVNSAVWGEHHLGAGNGAGDAMGVWIGTGVGGGLVLDGRIYHGALHTAGEIGHTVIDPGGAPGRRTVEDLCSRTGMRRVIGDRLADHPQSLLAAATGGDVARIDTAVLARAYGQRDPLAREVIDRAADLLGIAIANWITVLAIDRVYVGGGITEALGAPYLDRIRASFARDVFPERSRSCRLLMTTLAADAGLLGAALIARERVEGTRRAP